MSEALPPLKAVRAMCLWCQGGIAGPYETLDGVRSAAYRPYADVKQCETTRCSLHPYRHGRLPAGGRPGDVLKAIRGFCWGCLAGEEEQRSYRGGRHHNRARPTTLTRLCTSVDCPLHAFRTGKNLRRSEAAVR